MSPQESNPVYGPPTFEAHLQEQHEGVLGYLRQKTAALNARNEANGYYLIDSTNPEHVDLVSQGLSGILAVRYGDHGFPISAYTHQEVIKAQIDEGRLHTWLIIDSNGMPVGTASLVFPTIEQWEEAYAHGEPIMIEKGRIAALPEGDWNFNGTPCSYDGSARVALATYKAQEWLLSNGEKPKHPVVHGDYRASATRRLPDGTTLPGGEITQHTAWENGLRPWALHALYPIGAPSVQEPFLRCFKYMDEVAQRAYLNEHPIYVPNACPEFIDFMQAALKQADLDPRQLCPSQVYPASNTRLSMEDNTIYHEAKVVTGEGKSGLSIAEVIERVNDRNSSRGVLVKVPATQENMPHMQALVDAGFIPTGIIPGTKTVVHHPRTGEVLPYETPHYLTLTYMAPGMLVDAPEIGLPHDYTEDFSRATWNLWQLLRNTYS